MLLLLCCKLCTSDRGVYLLSRKLVIQDVDNSRVACSERKNKQLHSMEMLSIHQTYTAAPKA
jgi:hypothetical protein